MYLLIAVAHAVPVLLVAFISRSRMATALTAIVMIIIGAATGSPAYTGIDLFAVAIATWLSWQFLPARGAPEEPSTNKFVMWLRGAIKETVTTVLVLIAFFAIFGFAIIGYNRYLGDCADSRLAQLNMTFEQCRAAYTKKRP